MTSPFEFQPCRCGELLPFLRGTPEGQGEVSYWFECSRCGMESTAHDSAGKARMAWNAMNTRDGEAQ